MKKNYLIITIGTRDVQLRRDNIEQPGSGWQVTKQGTQHDLLKENIRLNARTTEAFPNYYFISSPRKDGQLIEASLDCFGEVLAIPLITPTLDKLLAEGQRIDMVLLIYTNQQVGFEAGHVSSFHYANDTYHFSGIVGYLLRMHPLTHGATIDYYEISEQVADIDYQYKHFGAYNRDLFEQTQDVEQVILLAQGGIDQINHAITLQLIQAFEQRVRLFQQPEAGEPKELAFTQHFLNDLNRQKLRKHIADYDFGYVSALTSNRLVLHLAQYAAKRLTLQHNQIQNNIEFLSRQDNILLLNPSLANWLELWQQPMGTEAQKLTDLYAAIKIADHQQRYTECLWKLFTLNEVLFRILVEQHFGQMKYNSKLTNRNDENEHWLSQLNQCPGLVDFLRRRSIWLNNPSRWAYLSIFEFMHPGDDRLLRAGYKLERLSAQRHRIAHELGSTSLTEINNALGSAYSLSALYEDLDVHFGLKDEDKGVFDLIQKQLLDWV